MKKLGISIDSVTHRSVLTGDIGVAPIGHREQRIIACRKNNNIDIAGLMIIPILLSEHAASNITI